MIDMEVIRKQFIDTIIANSVADDFENAIKEWDFHHYFTAPNNIKEECICGRKHITNVYVIKNRNNGVFLHTGSECIEKVTNYNSMLSRAVYTASHDLKEEKRAISDYKKVKVKLYETERELKELKAKYSNLERYYKEEIKKYELALKLTNVNSSTNESPVNDTSTKYRINDASGQNMQVSNHESEDDENFFEIFSLDSMNCGPADYKYWNHKK